MELPLLGSNQDSPDPESDGRGTITGHPPAFRHSAGVGARQLDPKRAEGPRKLPEATSLRLEFTGRTPTRAKPEVRRKPVEPNVETPEEQLDAAHQQLRSTIEAELLQQVKAASPEFFERTVVELLVRVGYGGTLADAGRAIGRSGDGGIDGMIKEDRLGLDVIHVQAKRWDNKTVGRPEVQGFAGSLDGVRARKGIFITTSAFSADALAFVDRIDKRIILIDGERLVGLMFDFGLGVTQLATYDVKRVDSDYFSEE